MKKTLSRRIAALLLCCLFLLPVLPVYAAQTEGLRCEKHAQTQPDGTVQITLEALQTGRVAAADIVLVLDVSASMEHNAVVPADKIDGQKDYYILHEYYYWNDDREVLRREYIPVHNTADFGETPVWIATPSDTGTPAQFDPAATPFYTGAMEDLRAAASSFVQSVADNAARYDADHRIAVVEFSAREAKGADALCTHDNNKHIPFYANILSGGGTAADALVSVRSHADDLRSIFAAMHGDGATYADDAMTQAKHILSASDRAQRVVILFTDGGPGSYGWTDDLDKSALPTANGAIAAAAQMKAQGVQIFTVGAFNENDLSSTAGENNRDYLNYVSSNYPDATSMTDAGTKVSDSYCSIGRTDMNLNAAFSAISAVIGAPVHSARVQDIVSAQFYLTDAQKRALLAAYPAAKITENDDDTTSIVFEDVDFPAVAVHADGTPVDPDSDGIFRMTFAVTPRESFLGGQGVSTNTGLCGVFADGVQLAQFASPQVDVPVNPDVVASLLSLKKDAAVFEGETLSPEQLYTDLSQSPAARSADSVTYTVTAADGTAFTGGTIPSAQTFTVTVSVVVDGETYTASGTVPVQVRENPVTKLSLLTLPTKTEYFVGETLSLDGISAAAWKMSGARIDVPAADLAASSSVFQTPGKQTVTVTYAGLSQSFTVTVKAVEAVSAKVVQSPNTSAYVYRTSPDFTGLAVEITYNNGETQIIRDLSEMTIRAGTGARVRRGTQTFTVSTHGVSAPFTMRVRLVWWQWLVLIVLFGWIWY